MLNVRFLVCLIALVGATAWGQENDPEWRAQIEAGNAEMATEEYQNAEVYFKLALDLAKEFDAHDPRVAYTAMRLGDVEMALGKRRDARDHFMLALPLFREREDDSLDQLGHCYLSLGDLDLAEQKHEAAKASYEYALRIHKLLEGNHLGVISSLYGLARCERIRKELGSSEAHLRQAIELLERTDSRPPNIGAILAEWARIKILKGKFAEAEPLLARAIQASIDARGPKHLEVADGLDTQAELMRLTHREALAKQIREKAARIRSRS